MYKILRSAQTSATVLIGEQQRDLEAEARAIELLRELFPGAGYVTSPDGTRHIPMHQVFPLAQALRDREEASRQSGYADGHRAGLAAGLAEAEAVLQRFNAAIADAIAQREQMLTDARREILELAIQISRKVTCDAIAIDQEATVTMIERIIAQLIDRSRICIKVHPDFLPIVEQHRDRFLSGSTQIKELTIQPDPRIRMGGCFIETPTGDIDARIESQLDVIADTVRSLEHA